jgi:hypothetical protein
MGCKYNFIFQKEKINLLKYSLEINELQHFIYHKMIICFIFK